MAISGERSDTTDRTTVEVVCTGHVYDAVGKHRFQYTFDGSTLRDLLSGFFDDHPVEDLLIARTEEEAIAHGWAPAPDPVPGTWRKNPEGDQTRAFARVLINGTFNEHLDGIDTQLSDGDRVSLMYPVIYCC